VGASEQDSEASADQESSEVELQCQGCPATSKSICPISKKRGTPQTIKWGKSATRKTKVRKGRKWVTKKKKVKCGLWCMNCVNLWRSHFKGQWKIGLAKLQSKLANAERRATGDGAHK